MYVLADVNECFQHRDICGEQDCLNLPGSYQCEEKCLSGFVREENGYCKGIKNDNVIKCYWVNLACLCISRQGF